MDGAAVTALQLWGLAVPVTLIIVGAIVWLIVHLSAAPGSTVSLLWGLATYQKKPERHVAPRDPLIDVVHKDSKTMWRIRRALQHWIDSDLSVYSPEHIDTIIVGPYHAVPTCKADLSYFDTSNTAGAWGKHRIHRICPSCSDEILPKRIDNSRSKAKQTVLRLIQQAHLRSEKIANGMEV